MSKLPYILFFLILLPVVVLAQQNDEVRQKEEGKLEIIYTSPENGAENVSTTPLFKVVFNQPIIKGEGYIYLYNSFGDIDAEINIEDAEVEVKGKQLQFSLNVELNADEKYHIEIDEGAIRVEDGDYFVGIDSDKVWAFSAYVEDNSEEGSMIGDVAPYFYPNPAINIIHLKGQKHVKEVQIFNLTGKIVMKNTSKSRTLNISSLPRGMYIISFIYQHGNIVSKKLIKK